MCLLASWIKRYQLDNEFFRKQIIDYKYRVDEPNVFYCRTGGASPFWKGVMWVAKDAKMGFQWQVGDGRKIKFWKDQWFGTFGPLLSSIVMCMSRLMSKTLVLLMHGMVHSSDLVLGDVLIMI
jgi:hypothetical protein